MKMQAPMIWSIAYRIRGPKLTRARGRTLEYPWDSSPQLKTVTIELFVDYGCHFFDS
jgi:hypothetical protein